MDWCFPKERVASSDWRWNQVNQALIAIPGVAETGLFIGYATKAYFGNADGTVSERP